MTDDKKLNPWKLTPKQCAVLRTLTEIGTVKGAAASLGIGKKTAEEHLRLAKRAMGAGSHVIAALQWDRYARDVKCAATEERAAEELPVVRRVCSVWDLGGRA